MILSILVFAHGRVNAPMAKVQFLRVVLGMIRSLTLRTCWMLRSFVCLVIAHMLDATPVMGWVGWGQVSTYRTKNNKCRSFPPALYIRAHALG